MTTRRVGTGWLTRCAVGIPDSQLSIQSALMTLRVEVLATPRMDLWQGAEYWEEVADAAFVLYASDESEASIVERTRRQITPPSHL